MPHVQIEAPKGVRGHLGTTAVVRHCKYSCLLLSTLRRCEFSLADRVLGCQGRAAEAIACYEHVALLQPESAEAHANLASCYKDAARQDAAITSYRRALSLRPDFPEAFANLVHSLQCVCEWRDRPALFQRMEVEVRIFESWASHRDH